MDQLQELLSRGTAVNAEPGLREMTLSLLLAFVLGQLIAWVYQKTHAGLSYSRSFTQSLVLINMVVALVMFVIGDSIVTAFGLIGALAIIRFRNVLKDTRDTVFVFFTLVLGMALGSQRYVAAVIGTAMLLTATIYLYWIRFGTRGLFDGHLSFRLGEAGEEVESLGVLKRFCRRFHSISVRRGAGVTEFVFQVRLRDRRRSDQMLQELEEVRGVGQVSMVLQDELSEI